MIQVPGIVRGNLGVANKTLALQLPLYPEHIRSALEGIHFGTINVHLETPLIIRVESYDLDTGSKRIKWHEEWVAERFLFKKCKIRRVQIFQDAWIYRSSSTPNSIDPYRVEVISTFIADLTPGSVVMLGFEKAHETTAITF